MNTKMITTLLLGLLIGANAYALDPDKARVHKSINLIKENVDFPFRKFYQVQIKKDQDPNAWSAGSVIIATTGLLEKLDDRQLLAVIAHEMAHREKYHLFSRISMFVGGAIAALLDRETKKPYGQRFNGFNEYYRLKQELQADCFAYNWLMELKHKGFEVDPLDLNSATNAIFEMDFGQVDPEIFDELPPYIRYKAIERGHSPNC